jgi:hypothetical protein
MTQTEEHDAAWARIEPARQPAGLPVAHGHRPPRLAVRLDAPEEAGALFQRVKDDYAALQAQVETAYQERVRAVQQEFAAGNMTPNQRTAALATANQERAARLDADYPRPTSACSVLCCRPHGTFRRQLGRAGGVGLCPAGYRRGRDLLSRLAL